MGIRGERAVKRGRFVIWSVTYFTTSRSRDFIEYLPLCFQGGVGEFPGNNVASDRIITSVDSFQWRSRLVKLRWSALIVKLIVVFGSTVQKLIAVLVVYLDFFFFASSFCALNKCFFVVVHEIIEFSIFFKLSLRKWHLCVAILVRKNFLKQVKPISHQAQRFSFIKRVDCC